MNKTLLIVLGLIAAPLTTAPALAAGKAKPAKAVATKSVVKAPAKVEVTSVSKPAPAAPAPAAPASAPAAPAPAAAAFSSSSTDIGTLLDNPATKAVLMKHMPGMAGNPQIDMARSMTLKQIQAYAGDQMTDDVLAKVDADLAKIPAK